MTDLYPRAHREQIDLARESIGDAIDALEEIRETRTLVASEELMGWLGTLTQLHGELVDAINRSVKQSVAGRPS